MRARDTQADERRRRAALALRLASGRPLELRVEGTSMEPGLPAGSRIEVRACDGGGPRPGELVTYLHGARLVSHRVIARGRRGRARDYLLTQGDNRRLPDPPVRLEQVIGTSAAPPPSDTRATLPASRAVARLARLLLEVHPGLARCVARG